MRTIRSRTVVSGKTPGAELGALAFCTATAALTFCTVSEAAGLAAIVLALAADVLPAAAGPAARKRWGIADVGSDGDDGDAAALLAALELRIPPRPLTMPELAGSGPALGAADVLAGTAGCSWAAVWHRHAATHDACTTQRPPAG